MISLLNNGSWSDWVSFGLSVLGAGSLTSAFWPGFWHVYKTKDTKFLPLGIFGCHLLVGALITAGSISGLAGWNQKVGLAKNIRTIVFAYLNGYLLITTGYTVGLAVYNKWKEEQKKKGRRGEQRTLFKTNQASTIKR